MDSAALAYRMLTILNPSDAEGWYNLGGCYFNVQQYAKAKESWELALRINPNYAEVKRAMAMLPPQLLGIPVVTPGIK
jgi:cytochrome c-type biogenesis protein CcmH/NrfG